MAEQNPLEENPVIVFNPNDVPADDIIDEDNGRKKKEKQVLSDEQIAGITGSLEDAMTYDDMTTASALKVREHIANWLCENHPALKGLFQAHWGGSIVHCEEIEVEFLELRKGKDGKNEKVTKNIRDLKIIKDASNLEVLGEGLDDKVWAPRVGAAGGQVKWYLENPLKLWKEAPKRRKYSDIVFKPFPPTPEGELEKEIWEANCKAQAAKGNGLLPYNKFRGFPIQPDPNPNPQERCQKILHHLKHVICDDDHTAYDWVLHWIANKFQNPYAKNKNRTALALSGGQGVGKSSFVHFLGRLIGSHSYLVVNDYNLLIQEFTVINDEHLIVFADEAGFNKDRKIMDKLKTLISDSTIEKNQKYLDSKTIEFAGDLIFSTNAQQIAALESDDRRYCVLEITKKFTQAEKVKYFNELFAEMDGEGAAAFLAYILSLDIELFKSTGGDLGQAPQTKARTEQKIMYFSPEEEWWTWCLENRTFGNCSINKAHDIVVAWDDFVDKSIPKKALMLSFQNWAKANGRQGKYGVQEVSLMKTIHTICPSISRSEGRVATNGANWSFLASEGKRLRSITLPSIDQARKDWMAKYTAHDYDWGDDTDYSDEVTEIEGNEVDGQMIDDIDAQVIKAKEIAETQQRRQQEKIALKARAEELYHKKELKTKKDTEELQEINNKLLRFYADIDVDYDYSYRPAQAMDTPPDDIDGNDIPW